MLTKQKRSKVLCNTPATQRGRWSAVGQAAPQILCLVDSFKNRYGHWFQSLEDLTEFSGGSKGKEPSML